VIWHLVLHAGAPSEALDRGLAAIRAIGCLDSEFAPLWWPSCPSGPSIIVRGISAGAVGVPWQSIEARDVSLRAYADPTVVPSGLCLEQGTGTVADVDRILSLSTLREAGLDGRSAVIAFMDSGIRRDVFRALGRSAEIRNGGSEVRVEEPGPDASLHGVMTAFDATIAAPGATLVDFPILRALRGEPRGAFGALLSDALLAHHVVLTSRSEIVPAAPWVICNSWAMHTEAEDYPVGDPRNYGANPVHPFNLIIDSLVDSGVDVVFAAGNCGQQCPVPRCRLSGSSIMGANSHPKAITVGAADVFGNPTGYSSRGPGQLAKRKPDLVAPAHFIGSRVALDVHRYGAHDADFGTSAAAAVVAGVVAALRTRWPDLPPACLRETLCSTAQRPSGFEPLRGWGMIAPARALQRLNAPPS
jgi:hypothetical protein